MKKYFWLLIIVAATITACQSTLKNPETADATLPDTPAPNEMCGTWLLMPPAIAVYKGTAPATSERPCLRLTENGRNAVLFETLGSDLVKLSGTIRFAPESTNSRGAFWLLAKNGDVTETANRHRSASASELKMLSAKQYSYRMDGEWLRIETGGEPTDASRTFQKI